MKTFAVIGLTVTYIAIALGHWLIIETVIDTVKKAKADEAKS